MNVKFSEFPPVTIKKKRSSSTKSSDVQNLRPKNRHLETVESERIIVIVDEAIKNMTLIATFDCIMEDLEDFAFLLGKQLYQLFRQLKPLYDTYSKICIQILKAKNEFQSSCLDIETDVKHNTYSLPEDFWTAPIIDLIKLEESTAKDKFSKSKQLHTEHPTESLEALEQKKKKLTPAVQFYIRSIIIAFRSNPHATRCILSHKEEWRIKRNVALVRLIELMNQLRAILFARLLTTPEERDERARFHAAVCRKEKEHQKVINELKERLETLKSNKEKTVAQMNFEVIDLQKEIYKMEIQGKNELNKLFRKCQVEIEEIEEQHEEAKAKLVAELGDMKVRYEELVEKNKQNELDIRRRKWKLETETENWINKYDSEMFDSQLQYDKLKTDYDMEKKSLVELQRLFEPLEKEYLQVLEEQRIAREKQEAERAENEALVYWATVIQSFWRAWKARKLMRKNRPR